MIENVPNAFTSKAVLQPLKIKSNCMGNNSCHPVKLYPGVYHHIEHAVIGLQYLTFSLRDIYTAGLKIEGLENAKIGLSFPLLTFGQRVWRSRGRFRGFCCFENGDLYITRRSGDMESEICSKQIHKGDIVLPNLALQ